MEKSLIRIEFMLRCYSNLSKDSMLHKAKTNFLLQVIPARIAKSSVVGQDANSDEKDFAKDIYYLIGSSPPFFDKIAIF